MSDCEIRRFGSRAFAQICVIRLIVLFTVLVAGLIVSSATGRSASYAQRPAQVHAVSIDPADYLSTVPDASVLAKQLVAQFEVNHVNTIYINAYNVEYGAYYRTSYRYNFESEYGRQDLLGKLVAAAHARGISVVAAFYDHQHRGAWEAQAGWREKTASGGDYNPPVTDIQYYLSPGNPQASAWWRGFLADVLRTYPGIDGVELREPIINWWGTSADYNPVVTRAFRAAHPSAALGGAEWRRFRQETLTRFLKSEIALVHRAGRFVDVTTVADAYGTGKLASVESQAYEVGFDLDGLLAGAVRPDAIKVELIWQQWARLYGRVAFTPGWTRTAAQAFLREVRGRAQVIVHVELTDFGRSTLSQEEFYRTLVAADIPQARGVDFYSARLADEKRAWPAVRAVYGQDQPATVATGIPPDRRVLVLYDEGTGAARERLPLALIEQTEMLNLLGHFDVKWETHPIEQYRRGELTGYTAVIYEGSVYGNAPQSFLSDVSVFDGSVVWIGQSLFQLADSGVHLPFSQPSQKLVTSFPQIRYSGVVLPAKGEVILTHAGPGAVAMASLVRGKQTVPFVLRAGRFWYVAGSPFSFVSLASPPGLNGRYLVFADLLHDVLGQAHKNLPRQAFVRIEDVNPLTSASVIRDVADALAAEHVPFLVSVTPFYVDPTRNLSVSLSQRPATVEALRYAVAHGGALVLHGSTHQYTGTTGVDAEFWDLKNKGGLPDDSEDFVRGRVERALNEMWRNDLHPLAWETPHYLATPFDNATFGDYFSTFVEQRLYGIWRGSAYQQPLPYNVNSDVYGGRVIPENLGYVIAGQEDADALVANAGRLLVVRDATAGGFVHVGTDPRIMVGLVKDLRRLGYRFLDLYSIANVVETSQRVELTGAGTASLAVPSGWSLQERILDRSGGVVRSTLDRFPSYARPERSFATAPSGGLLSLRVLTPTDREAAQTDDRGGGRTDGLIVYGILAIAAGGIALLALAYTLVRVQRPRTRR